MLGTVVPTGLGGIVALVEKPVASEPGTSRRGALVDQVPVGQCLDYGVLARLVDDEGPFLAAVFRQFGHDDHGGLADSFATRKGGCPDAVFSLCRDGGSRDVLPALIGWASAPGR